MCILRTGLVLITVGTCGIWTADAAETAVATKAAGGPIVIEDGAAAVPVTMIVVDPAAHAVEKAAARELQSYLVRMGGAQVPIVESAETVATTQGVIFVGPGKAAAALCQPAALAELGPDGFILRCATTATSWRWAGTIAGRPMPCTGCSSIWGAGFTPGTWRSCPLWRGHDTQPVRTQGQCRVRMVRDARHDRTHEVHPVAGRMGGIRGGRRRSQDDGFPERRLLAPHHGLSAAGKAPRRDPRGLPGASSARSGASRSPRCSNIACRTPNCSRS